MSHWIVKLYEQLLESLNDILDVSQVEIIIYCLIVWNINIPINIIRSC